MSESGGTQPTTLFATGGAGTPQHTTQTGAAGAVSAAITAGAGKFAYLTGFEVTGTGATATSLIVVTVTTPTVRANYELTIPAGAGAAMTPLQVTFPTPIVSDAAAGSVTVNVPSFGAGSTAQAVNAHGYTA
jgi:hypothetical protein